jgi:hypothetical protein
MFFKVVKIAAWCSMIYIVIVTLSPISLRPVVTSDPLYERFAAFAGTGLLFGLGYPHRRVSTFMLVLCAIVVLEALQIVTPDRHAGLTDVFEKAAGGITGLVLSNGLLRHCLNGNFFSRQGILQSRPADRSGGSE